MLEQGVKAFLIKMTKNKMNTVNIADQPEYHLKKPKTHSLRTTALLYSIGCGNMKQFLGQQQLLLQLYPHTYTLTHILSVQDF